MQKVINYDSYIDERGYRIISCDFGKYVNHCCNCNTISNGYGFEVAVRDIQPGEQLTDEYGIFNLQEEMILHCSFEGCRKKIKPSDFDEYYQEWDVKIKEALPQFNEVEQALLPFVDATTIAKLNEYFLNPEAYRSVYNLRFKG